MPDIAQAVWDLRKKPVTFLRYSALILGAKLYEYEELALSLHGEFRAFDPG
jgi:hypothetical protein